MPRSVVCTLSASKNGMDKPIGVRRVWQGAANPSPEIFFLLGTALNRGKQKIGVCVCVCVYVYVYIYIYIYIYIHTLLIVEYNGDVSPEKTHYTKLHPRWPKSYQLGKVKEGTLLILGTSLGTVTWIRSAAEAQVQTSALDGERWSMQDRARLKSSWRLLRGSQTSSGPCGEHGNAVSLPTFKTNPDFPTSGPFISHCIKFCQLCFQLTFHRVVIINNKNYCYFQKRLTSMNIPNMGVQ